MKIRSGLGLCVRSVLQLRAGIVEPAKRQEIMEQLQNGLRLGLVLLGPGSWRIVSDILELLESSSYLMIF